MLNFGSSNIVSKSRIIGRRMFLLSAIKTVVFLGIFGRLVQIQITESRKYKTLSDKNRFREWRLAPPRGILKDFYGTEIASNERIYQLHITPENTQNIEHLFFKLKNILNLKDQKIFALKRKIAKQKPWEPIVVSDNLSWSEFSKVNLFLHELQGAEPIVSVARVYKDHSSPHILGYVSKASVKDLNDKKYLREMNIPGVSVGKTGLEHKLDKDIIGNVGFLRYEVNAYGKRIRQISTDSGIQGKTFRTTLDNEVQKFTADLIKDKSGAVCVMDIYNGDIVSMVSAPTFNPNSFIHGISKKEWNELLNHRDKPMINKAISGLYPPGSTIKPIVALSALENDLWNPETQLRCKGHIEFHDQKYHCWKKKGHGIINMRTAIKKSCDVYFYEVARILGVDKLSKTAEKFGLGQTVLNGLKEEKVGIVPNTNWKLNTIGKNWYIGETLHSGIGQGYYLTTPLQLCLMTAQIANGGYRVKPRLIFGEEDLENNLTELKQTNLNEVFGKLASKPLFRNQENINFIKEAMFASSNEVGGTSYASRLNDEKFTFAGKTGSSQIKRFTEEQREAEVKQKDIEYLSRDHALFVAFAPYKNPKYAISVLIEHGGSGSSSAAPVAKKVIKKVIERDNLRNSQKNKFVSKEI